MISAAQNARTPVINRNPDHEDLNMHPEMKDKTEATTHPRKKITEKV
jgi:hypothetical protein